MKPYEKVAQVLVAEIGGLAEMEAVLELGHRVAKLGPEVYGTFGLGCGGGCDAWGLVCGNNCLQGLPHMDEVIRARFAIDVLGKKGLTDADMATVGRNFTEIGETAVRMVARRLSFERMDERIGKYGG